MQIIRSTFDAIKVGSKDKCFYQISLQTPDAIKDPDLKDIFLWGINNIGTVLVKWGVYSKETMGAAYCLGEIFEEEQDKNPLFRDIESSGPFITFKTWWNPFSTKLVNIAFRESMFDEFNSAFINSSDKEVKIDIFDPTVLSNEKFISMLAGFIASKNKVTINLAIYGVQAEVLGEELTSASFISKLKKYDNCDFVTSYSNDGGKIEIIYTKTKSLKSLHTVNPTNDFGLDLEDPDLYSHSLILDYFLRVQDIEFIYEKLRERKIVEIKAHDVENRIVNTGVRFERSVNGEVSIYALSNSPDFDNDFISKNIISPFLLFSIAKEIPNIALGFNEFGSASNLLEVEIVKSRVSQRRFDLNFGKEYLALKEGPFSVALSDLVSDLIDNYYTIGIHLYGANIQEYEEFKNQIKPSIHSRNKYSFLVNNSPRDKYLLITT